MDLNVIECNFIASLSYCLDITLTDRPHCVRWTSAYGNYGSLFPPQKKKLGFYLVLLFFLDEVRIARHKLAIVSY